MSRTGSTETIKVRMSASISPYTPEQAMKLNNPIATATSNQAPNITMAWMHYPQSETTPDRSMACGGLGTPYTPSRYGGHGGGDTLGIPDSRRDVNRDTTFSGILQRAGVDVERNRTVSRRG